MLRNEQFALVHSGHEEDIEIVIHIVKAIETAQPGICIDYTLRSNEGNKETLIWRNLKRSSENQLQLIVVLSTNFFETVWPTSMKPEILNFLLRHLNGQCVHVWTNDLNSEKVQRYSCPLARSDDSKFRTITFQEILGKDHMAAGRDILEKLVTVPQKDNKDYPAKGVMELAKLNLQKRLQGGVEKPLVFGSLPHQQSPKPHRPNIYKSSPTTQRHKSVANPKKPRSKPRRGEDEMLLNEVPYFHLYELSDRLDHGLNADYRKLASMFNLSQDDINQLNLAPLRGQRPTEQLIRTLNMRNPSLRVKDFELKCAEMKRNDVVKYIQEKIYKK